MAYRVSAKSLYHRKYPKKAKAHKWVTSAVKRGVLKRQPCEVCGCTDHIEAHHDNYDAPKDVRWLCQAHHLEWHKYNKAINGE